MFRVQGLGLTFGVLRASDVRFAFSVPGCSRYLNSNRLPSHG